MRPVFPALAVVALAGVLAGCSGPPPIDEAALHRWEVRERASDEDTLLFARVDAGGDAPTSIAKPQVSTTFPSPTRIRSVELACFGDARIEGALTIRAGSTTRSVGLPSPVACADGRYRFRLSTSERSGVEMIGFAGFHSTRETAWMLHVRTDLGS